MEHLTSVLSTLIIDNKNINSVNVVNGVNGVNGVNIEKHIIKIQKWFRGCILRLKQMPLIMYKIQKYISSISFQFSHQNEDGRINSCLDETEVKKLLYDKFTNRIQLPKIRIWYDILAFDYIYGWIPINIKTTTTTTSDNIGNLSLCVHSYTDVLLDIHRAKTYDNGIMSKMLFNKIKNKEYNKSNKKDYYFVVLNKNDCREVIINSMKGLSFLTPNVNNLPFQINWSKNRTFHYEHIVKKIHIFINCLQKPQPSWKETFMANIRTLESN